MVEMEVHRVQVSSRAYHRVVLRAKQVESSLHIVIGPSEASAIALGHPLGASGARLALTAIRQLHCVKGQYALVTLCIGVGQGLAAVFERTF